MSDTYPNQLDRHLKTGDYSEETITFLHRACRVGRVSEQFVLDVLNVVEVDYAQREADKVFGAVPGAVPTIEVFSDHPTLFGEDLTLNV